MSLIYKDGGGTNQLLKTRQSGGQHVVANDLDGPLPAGTNAVGSVGLTPASANTNGATAKSDATALEANPERRKWGIQNAGTNALTVVIGNSSINLRACLNQDDGTGGSIEDEYWQGAVTVTGTSPRYHVFEFV